jgi:hypothetical protein
MMLTMMGAMALMMRETIADNARAAFTAPCGWVCTLARPSSVTAIISGRR